MLIVYFSAVSSLRGSEHSTSCALPATTTPSGSDPEGHTKLDGGVSSKNKGVKGAETWTTYFCVA
jgi:hypothetical protein